jgi:hypothetical protein
MGHAYYRRLGAVTRVNDDTRRGSILISHFYSILSTATMQYRCIPGAAESSANALAFISPVLVEEDHTVLQAMQANSSSQHHTQYPSAWRAYQAGGREESWRHRLACHRTSVCENGDSLLSY